jgi:hypothetical protein
VETRHVVIFRVTGTIVSEVLGVKTFSGKLTPNIRFVVLGCSQVPGVAAGIDSESALRDKGGCEDDDGTDGGLIIADLGESRKDVVILPPILVDDPSEKCREHRAEDDMTAVKEGHDCAQWRCTSFGNMHTLQR